MKNFSEIQSLLSSRNKRVRDEAAKVFNAVLEKHSDSAEAEMNSILEFKKVNDNLRGIERPDFPRHLGDDIDSEVVDSMLDAVSSRFDLAHRFYELNFWNAQIFTNFAA